MVKEVVDAVQGVINAKDGDVKGFTEVYLEGERNFVRSEFARAPPARASPSRAERLSATVAALTGRNSQEVVDVETTTVRLG